MKPPTAAWRSMVARRLGAVAIAAAGGLVVAGCASGGSAQPGSSSVAKGVSSPTPLISVGSPAPSDAAERSRVQAVTELATRLLAQVPVPEGSKQLQGQHVADAFDPWAGWNDVIDAADSWKAPGTADAVLTYVQHHLPAGLTWNSSGGGAIGTESVSYRAAAGPADEGATLQIEVATDPVGGVDLRVDVQDVWQPVRPATARVPPTVTGAALVRRRGVTTSPPPPTTVTIHAGAKVARHIAAILNGLPSEAGGPPDAGGGADTTITVSFDGDPSQTQYVVAGSFYDAVTVRAPKQALPTLSNAGELDNYLEGLF